ncbi:MAG: PTS galactitol transporter subunit IIB [Gammaproteobacteria bacterium]|nr:PTS galactitol transporter subunit IIB [Gammaproteobacteria bacterium]
MNDTKKYKIASVCGSGYATSGWIATKLKDALKERDIEAEITEVKVMDLAMVVENFDLIVSASVLNDIYGVPVVASSSIITGIGFEETLEEIIHKLKEVKDK